jgi:hypothetical protein
LTYDLQGAKPGITTEGGPNRLDNVTPCSDLDQIQTTIPPLILQFILEVCISRGLTFLGPLSIRVPGTSQLDQGYPNSILDCVGWLVGRSVPTMRDYVEK